MLLLSDGTVMAANAGGNAWYQLIPDAQGNYTNGTWRSLASMHDSRLYYSSAVLVDGRVFVAGGEYGTGTASAEVYDPSSNRWTYTAIPWQTFSDSISKILPDGKVLVAPVGPIPSGSTILYDPLADSWLSGGKLYRGSYQDEASWVKLPDDSILTIDPFGTNSERYIPSLNRWINDANVPVALYDPYGGELGPGFLLADGRAFFLGSSGHTAFYTPSGNTLPGTWTRGPDFPNGQGTPDAPAAMMVNGKILCVTSPTPTSADHFPKPASFYEYDPGANSFTSVPVPSALASLQQYVTRMLDLPDGTVLFSHSANQLYVYRPDGSPLAEGKPSITSISQNPDGSFHLVGTLLNGISEGAAYGDDAQMSSCYPLVRLTASGGGVYYARTYNWSSTSVMTGSRPLSTEFALPASLAPGPYQLVVSANGNASDPVQLTTAVWLGAPTANWDTSSPNWLKSASAASFNSGDFVIFDDTLTGASQVTLSNAVTPGGVLFKNSRTNYTISGVGWIGGTAGLVLSGQGNVTLAESGGDNFSGGIVVNRGTLVLDVFGSQVSGGMLVGPGAVVFIGNHDGNGGLPSGGTTNNGTLVFNQTTDSLIVDPITGAGNLIKNEGNTLTLAGTNSWSGNTLINSGTLALVGGGTLGGSTNIAIAAGAQLAVSARSDGALTLVSGQTLQGEGTVTGDLWVGPGSLVTPGLSSAPVSSLSISSNLTLRGSVSMRIGSSETTNDIVYASTISYGGVLVLSNISSAPLAEGNTFRMFIASNYSGAFTAVVPPIPGPGLAWDTNALTIDGSLRVEVTPGDTWRGAVDGHWDTTTTNWSVAGTPGAYVSGDGVVFDDSVVGTSTVVLSDVVSPGSITFNNSASNYTVIGSGSLLVTNTFLKNLPGSVTLSERGGDQLIGGIIISNGSLTLDNVVSNLNGGAVIGPGATLQLGLNDTNGGLPAGNLSLSGSLVLNRTDDLTLSQPISGFGSLIKSNADVVTLAQNNVNWTGAVRVAQGTLRLGAPNALGRGTNVAITILNGASVDLNGVSGTNSVIASGTGLAGTGAVVNNSSSAQALPGLAFLTLVGDTTIGGANRWDLRPAGAAPDTAGALYAGLNTGGRPFALTKTGPNTIGIVSTTVDPSLGPVNVQSGTLILEGDLPGFGNPSASLTVLSNATLQFRNLGRALSKTLVLDDGAIVSNGSGANILDRPITLNTNSAGAAGNITFNIAGSYLWLNPGVMSGLGGLTKIGTATLRLSGTNSYRGNTVINGGVLSLWSTGSIQTSPNISIGSGATLKADDRTDKTLTLNSGQILSGNGTLSGILVAHAGSTVMPGQSPTVLGSLTVSSNATLQGTTLLKLNAATVTSDILHAYSVTYGGALTLTNISATPLTGGNSFRLFAATKYSGAFAAISPARPGPGLLWNTNNLGISGTLSVEALPSPWITGFSVYGNDLILTATNGIAGSSCSVLMSTNVALPLVQWVPVSTNLLNSSGSFTVVATNAVDSTAPELFYTLRIQ